MKGEVLLSGPTRRAIQEISGPRPLIGLAYCFRTFALIGAAIGLALRFPHSIAFVFSIVFIGARQHSLYVLNHDASHGVLLASKRMNKILATLLSNLTFFHHPEAYSYVQWRRVHRLHHAYLFTSRDPNYVERKLNGETRVRFGRGRLLFEMLKAGPQAIKSFFVGRQDYVPPGGMTCEKRRFNHLATLTFRFKGDPEMELERRIKIGFFVAALLALHFTGLWRPFVLFWILPMYTVYPGLLRLMDLTEHQWQVESTRIIENAASTRPNLLEHWLISDLNRSLHREHHLFPMVPGFRLPRLSELLVAASHLDRPRSSFLFDP